MNPTNNRVILQKYSMEDSHALEELLNNYDVSKWTAGICFPFNLEDAKNWIKKQNNLNYCYGIFLQEKLIGDVALYPTENNTYELGYWIGQSYWGNGYAKEASLKLLQIATENISRNNVYATCEKGHVHSEKILQELGFYVAGETQSFSKARNKEVLCNFYKLAD